MKKIDDATIRKVEGLSMLKLSDEERTQIAGDLERIVNMFDKLNEVETTDVEPLVHINPEAQVLAADEFGEHIDKQKALDNSKNTEKGFFTVPKIIK